MEGAELAAAMKNFQEVVEPAVEVGSCWECEVALKQTFHLLKFAWFLVVEWAGKK